MLLLALLGCSPSTELKLEPAPFPEIWVTATEYSARSVDGLLAVEIDAEQRHKSFLLAARSTGHKVGIDRVADPKGNTALDHQDWIFADENLTWGVFAEVEDVVFNWPIRERDGPLRAGTYTIELATLDSSDQPVSADVDVVVFHSPDPDTSAGEVRVDIWFARGARNPITIDAAEVAVERWREIWDAHGLSVRETWRGVAEIDKVLSFVEDGSDDVASLVSDKGDTDLVLLIGEQFGPGRYDGFYGVSGGIPGSLAPTPWTWTTVSWLAHAGTDATFTDDEKRWMGDTMAHEVGHYLGLFHPVECGSDCGGSWDALEDTPRCSGWQTCEAEIGHNLMFPYPICSMDTCEDQTELTGDQVHVGQHYTGVY